MMNTKPNALDMMPSAAQSFFGGPADNDNGFVALPDAAEDALRHLGEDILNEPVPGHLLALLSDS